MSIPVDFQQRLDKAEALTQAEEYKSAFAVVESLLSMDPRPPYKASELQRLYYLRGYFHWYFDNFEQAVSDLSESLSLDADDHAYELRALSKQEIEGFDYADVIQDFTNAIQLNSTLARLYSGRAFCYSRIKDHEKALVDLNEAIRLEPETLFYFARRGYQHLELNNPEAGLQDLNQAINGNPDVEYQAFYWRGNAHYEFNHHLEAKNDYAAAIATKPDTQDARLYALLADCQYNLNQVEDALLNINRAIDLNQLPNNAYMYELRAHIHLNLKNYAEAETDINQAIAQYDDVFPVLVKVFLLQETNRYSEALALCNEVLSSQPNHQEALSRKAVTLSMLDQIVESLEIDDRLIQFEPTQSDYYANRGAAKYNLLDNVGAQYDFEKAIELNPEQGQSYYGLAHIAMDKENYSDALALFSKALDLSYEVKITKLHCMEIHLELNDTHAAQALYEDLKQNFPESDPVFWNRIHLFFGNYEEALDSLTNQPKEDPSQALEWVQTYQKLGQMQEALEIITPALAYYKTTTNYKLTQRLQTLLDELETDLKITH